MEHEDLHFTQPSFEKRVLVIVGGYGSGKSEIAVNLARYLRANGTESVSIADLDIVNPYFRSREAAKRLEAFGVKSLIPAGSHAYADLPIIIPDIHSAVEEGTGKLILDVGGDDVGARVLSSIADAFQPDSFEMLLVLNARRPFTSDVDNTMRLMAEIEISARLRFTGIISNTHLMHDTTKEVVMEGLSLARRVSQRCGLPVTFVSAVREIAKFLDPDEIRLPLLVLDRALVKPWEHVGNTWTDKKLRIH